jgi:UDP-N-acetylmuramoyl-tripeptide--D-alanyl-D-alanine ligase
MIDRTAAWIAAAAGGELVGGVGGCEGPGPRRVEFEPPDSTPEDLFVALGVAGRDPLEQARTALEQGAWGLLAKPEVAAKFRNSGRPVIAAEVPGHALRLLARAWRRELGATVIGVTGSSGKTSTKDILRALLKPVCSVHANWRNFNNQIGMPITILQAERGTDVLVLELATRELGGVASLSSYAEPDLGVLVNIGPAHLKLFGGLLAVAEAKAELIAALPAGGTCVIPAREPLLDPYLRDDLDTVRFGDSGEVTLRSFSDGRAEIDARGHTITLELAYDQPYNLTNTLAAVAAATALGYTPAGRVDPDFSPGRGQRIPLAGQITLIDHTYNANPASVMAVLNHLATVPATRRVAVLGFISGLGHEREHYHREVGRHAHALGIDVLITVAGPAAEMGIAFGGVTHHAQGPGHATKILSRVLAPGDVVLLMGSSLSGLDRVGDRLRAARALDPARS